MGMFIVRLKKSVKEKQAVSGLTAAQAGAESGDQVGTKSGLSRDQVKILCLCRQEQSLVAMMKSIGRQNRTKFRDSFVKPLVDMGLLELTIPGKPTSRLQKYRLTEKGRSCLKGFTDVTRSSVTEKVF